MKYPKTWNKMNLVEQEAWLVKKLTEVYDQETSIKKMLGKVRGGEKINIVMDERPDLALLKNED